MKTERDEDRVQQGVTEVSIGSQRSGGGQGGQHGVTMSHKGNNGGWGSYIGQEGVTEVKHTKVSFSGRSSNIPDFFVKISLTLTLHLSSPV